VRRDYLTPDTANSSDALQQPAKPPVGDVGNIPLQANTTSYGALR